MTVSLADFNWTAYAVIYQIHKKTKASCIVVPKVSVIFYIAIILNNNTLSVTQLLIAILNFCFDIPVNTFRGI